MICKFVSIDKEPDHDIDDVWFCKDHNALICHNDYKRFYIITTSSSLL